MKVVYTENIPKHPDPNVCYRSSFLGVIGGATSVEVDDDFPDADLVDQAYAFLDNQPKSQTVSLNVGITPELQASLGDQPCTRTPGIVFIQLFAPLHSGTLELSKLADKWAEHMQFYKFGDLEMLQADILDAGHSSAIGDPSTMSFYQYNVNVSYRVN